MTPQAVLFDCDGVIVDSEEISAIVVLEELAAFGLDMSPARLERLFVGRTLGEISAHLRAEGIPIPNTWNRDMDRRINARLVLGTPLIDGIEEVLATLDAAGLRYAVGSNGSLAKMRTTLSQHPDVWVRLRDRLHSADHVAHPKPAPDIWLAAAAGLGLDPGACVVVDDSPTGCAAGIAGGFRTLGFAGRDGLADMLTSMGIETFSDMRSLPGLIGLTP